jgi:hypothetical protein
MKYIVSNNGAGIAVGLIGNKQEAKCLATLAVNLYNVNISDEYFDHLIYMPSMKKFKELLVMAAYYNEWDEYWESINHYKFEEGQEEKARVNQSFVLKFTKAAIRTMRNTMEKDVKLENFMQNISNRSQTYSMGSIYAEKSEE